MKFKNYAGARAWQMEHCPGKCLICGAPAAGGLCCGTHTVEYGLYRGPQTTWEWLEERMVPAVTMTEPGKCRRCGLPNEYQPGPYTCWQCTQDPYR